MSFMLPLPFTLILRVTASLASTSFVLMLEETEKCPTAPEKPSGLLGNGETLMVRVGVVILRFTSV